jgi:hypothetical protein
MALEFDGGESAIPYSGLNFGGTNPTFMISSQ